MVINSTSKSFLINSLPIHYKSTLLYEINTTIARTKVLNGWADSGDTLDHTYHILDVNSLIIDSTIVDAATRIIEAEKKMQILR